MFSYYYDFKRFKIFEGIDNTRINISIGHENEIQPNT